MRPVGGVFEKAYGAKQAGIRTLVIPKENDKDIPEGHLGLDIHAVETAEEAFAVLFAPEADGEPLLLHLEKPASSEKADEDGKIADGKKADSNPLDAEDFSKASLEKPKEAV